jgi:hypothetical protein
MRRSKGLALVAAAAMALAAAAPVAAQEDTAAAVSGTIEECLVIAQGTTTTGPAGSAETINQVWECMGQADDERLSGTISIVYNVAGWTDVGAVQWGWARIENDGGYWEGSWSSNVQADGEQVILGWYQGGGGYEGWSYVETQYGEYQQPRETFGIVYPADLPPNIVLVPPEETEAPVAE